MSRSDLLAALSKTPHEQGDKRAVKREPRPLPQQPVDFAEHFRTETQPKSHKQPSPHQYKREANKDRPDASTSPAREARPKNNHIHEDRASAKDRSDVAVQSDRADQEQSDTQQAQQASNDLQAANHKNDSLATEQVSSEAQATINAVDGSGVILAITQPNVKTGAQTDEQTSTSQTQAELAQPNISTSQPSSALPSLTVNLPQSTAPTADAAAVDSIAASGDVLAHAPAQELTSSEAASPSSFAKDTRTVSGETADQSLAKSVAASEQAKISAPDSLIEKLQPENKADDLKLGDAPTKPDAAKAKPDVLPEQSAAIAKTKALTEKVDAPAPAPKTENGQALGHLIVKADTPTITAPNQYGHQISHTQHVVQQSPIHEMQQAIARAPMAIERVPFEITIAAHRGEKEFEIRLDPADMGRIDVSLSVDKSGKVSTHLIVERPETLDQLRRDAPNLERALQNSGLKTDQGSMQFSLRDQNAQNFSGEQNKDSITRRGVMNVEYYNTVAMPHMAYLGATRGHGIDMRV